MAPKKKQPFMVFLLDKKDEDQRKGIRRDMSWYHSECGRLWAEMTEEQRKPYKDKAQASRSAPVSVPVGFHHAPPSNIAMQQMERDIQKENRENTELSMLRLTHKVVNDILEEEDSEEKLLTQAWVVGSVNVMVRTRNGEYFPLEIAFTTYSVKEGIISSFHRHVNPGPPPLGYFADAKDHCEHSHKIPFNPVLDYAVGAGDDDVTRRRKIEDMLVEVLLFLSDTKVKDFDGKPIYLIFCKAGDESDDPDGSLNAEQLQKSLEALANQTGNRDLIRTFRDEVKVAPLHLLLHNVHKACAGDKPLPFFQSALNSTAFDFCRGSCDFHEENENNFCALGVTKRLWYRFSDVILGVIGMEPIPCKHMPVSETNIRVEIGAFPGFDDKVSATSQRQRTSSRASTTTSYKPARSTWGDEDGSSSKQSSLSDSSRRIPGIGRGRPVP